MNDAFENLAKNLAALWEPRKTSDLPSQMVVAEQAGIDQTTFSRVLRKKHPPTLTQVVKLAAVFKVEPWQLLAPGLGAHLFELTADRKVLPVATPSVDESILRRRAAIDDEVVEGSGWTRRSRATRSRRASGT